MSDQHQHQSYVLPPLPRRYHNLPAPVIYPPRSDPRFFMNPSPTASSMDADPCVVASRAELVAKEFDLTASEHAGVSLTEASTITSTTSDHPTNHSAVVSQTVKDLLTTKTENKNTSFNSYDVCNVNCNSEISFKKHMERKIDLTQKPTSLSTVKQEASSPDPLDQEPAKKMNDVTQKLLVLTATEQETQSFVANGISDPESKNKNQDLLQKAAEFRSLSVYDFPQPGPSYPKIVTVEIDESFLKNGVLNPTSVSRTPIQPCNVDTQNRPAKCFDKNVESKQHKKNETWCEICKITCSSNDYNKHQSGKKHIKNSKKLENIPKSPSTIDSVTAWPAENMKLTKGEVVNPNEGNSAKCELCGVYYTSTEMLNQHISGKKHQKNLKKFEKQCVVSPRVAKTPSPEPMNEEGEIVFSDTSKRKANDSSASQEDADAAKRQKMNEEQGCGVLVVCKGCNVVCNGLEAYKTHHCRV
ncbi:hypothetical protein R6Q59_034210 [Mikania micrantha]